MKKTLKKHGADHPYRKVRALLRTADVVFGNLENPVGSVGERAPDKDFHFLMDPPHVAALKRAGFSVMSLANNHALDFGPQALERTLVELRALGIATCGAGRNLQEARRPALCETKSGRVAFLAYHRTPPISFSADPDSITTAWGETPFVERDIRQAKSSATWVIVSFHWGKEYTEVPGTELRKLAHAAINAGADVVVGHHPHIVQGLEIYKERIIAYSLGNFVFGTRNQHAENGLLLKISLKLDRPPQCEIVPLLVNNYKVSYQPRPLSEKEASKFLKHLDRLSRRFKTRMRLAKGRAYLP